MKQKKDRDGQLGVEINMNVTLINPTIGRINNGRSYRKWVLEPLSLASLAGVTPEGIKLRIFDDRTEEINYNEPTDLVGISVETTTALRSYEIADRFRKRGIPVVLGGFHPTLMPEEAKQHADSIVVGQAEDIWAKVLEDSSNGHIKERYRGSPNGFLKGSKPSKKIFTGKNYLPFYLIETGRGCVFDCDFCAVREFFDESYYPRPVNTIIEEISRSGKKNLLIVDDNVASKKSHLEELCERLIPLNVNWASQASISVSENEKLLDLMQKSGCKGLLIGFESLVDENLRQMNKVANLRKKDYSRSIAKLRERGIRVYGSFVIGYDSDTPKTISDTLNFAVSEKLAISNLYPLTPIPSTPLYARLKEEGRMINSNWWLDYKHQYGDIVFQPKNFSPVELKKLCDKARREFYSWNSIITRSFDTQANSRSLSGTVLYFIANYLTRKEILAKEKTFLGYQHDTI